MTHKNDPSTMKEYREAHKEEIAAYMKKYHAEHVEKRRAAHKRWKANNPDTINALRRKHDRADPLKYSARRAVTNAVYSGTLIRPSVCDKCGGGGTIEAHHHDYAKKLEVIWVCGSCHRAIHKEST